jgi:nitroimidazol reductase NimA-like FMN-containing flavoprotein (pyridoxamine 5'-phosphate oxidase superfamily)
MAQETMEKKSRSRRTMRATKPVCFRISKRSVTKIAVNRKMMYPSVSANVL